MATTEVNALFKKEGGGHWLVIFNFLLSPHTWWLPNHQHSICSHYHTLFIYLIWLFFCECNKLFSILSHLLTKHTPGMWKDNLGTHVWPFRGRTGPAMRWSQGDIKLLMGRDLKVTGTVGCRRMSQSCRAQGFWFQRWSPVRLWRRRSLKCFGPSLVLCFFSSFFFFMTSAKVSSDCRCFSRNCCSGCNVVKLISLSLFQPS